MSKTARTSVQTAAAASGTAPNSDPDPRTATGTAPESKPALRKRRKARIDIDRVPVAKPKQSFKSASKAAKPAAPKPTKPAAPSRGKHQPSTRLSALDAAAQVLAGLSKAEARDGITAPDLIERMAKAKLWTSPGGKTPAATLYAAMVREIARNGSASRFVRVSPGHFAANRAAAKIGGRS